VPEYNYKCSECGRLASELRRVKDRNKKVPCVLPTPGDPGHHCEGVMERSPWSERKNSPNQDYRKPVLSDAMAVHPAQVAEHRKEHPNIPILDDGRVVCRSHADRKRIMKELGFHDKDGYG